MSGACTIKLFEIPDAAPHQALCDAVKVAVAAVRDGLLDVNATDDHPPFRWPLLLWCGKLGLADAAQYLLSKSVMSTQAIGQAEQLCTMPAAQAMKTPSLSSWLIMLMRM